MTNQPVSTEETEQRQESRQASWRCAALLLALYETKGFESFITPDGKTGIRFAADGVPVHCFFDKIAGPLGAN